MSVEIARQQIFRFIESQDSTVLALRGPWGVGKTHAWKTYLLQATQEGKVGLEKYAYVSLFGVDSIRALKTAIFERSVSGKDIGIAPAIEASTDGLARVAKSVSRKSMRVLNGFFNNHEQALEYLSFTFVRHTLICIDDLERRGEGLSLKDVLGLVSHLSEEKGCKIVLILNDAEEGLEDYQKYREKVVDVELKFNPTPAECAEHSFVATDHEIAEILTSVSSELEIRNIRILRKARKYAIELTAYLTELEEPLRREVLQSLMLYVWSVYGESEGAPPVSYILDSQQRIFGIENEDSDNQPSEIERGWEEILQKVNFSYVDEIDLLLIEGVQAGYFDMQSLVKRLESKNAEVARSIGQERYSSAWALFHHSFDNNQDEVVNVLYREFMSNAKHITPVNLSGTVQLLKELGESEKSSDVLEAYIKARRDEPNLFDLKNSNFWGDIRDPDVVRRFKEIASSTQEGPATLLDVLLQMAGKNGWSKEEEKVLTDATQSDYYDLFKSYKGNDLRRIVQQSLQFSTISNASTAQNDASERAKAALKDIASECGLNRLRIGTYGIDLNESEENN